MRRTVYIKKGRDIWHVMYAERGYRQRYCAAGFYAPDYSMEYVIEWIDMQPSLELVPEDSPKVL